MARPSNIDRMPQNVREAIAEWRRNGKTIGEIHTALEEEFGVTNTSPSGIGRHTKKLNQALSKVSCSRHVAEAIVTEFGHDLESKTARAGIELLQSSIMEMLLEEDVVEEDGTVIPGGLNSPKQALELSRAFAQLAKARKEDAALMSKIREEARKEIASTTATAAREAGVDEAAISAIMSHLNELAQKPGAEA